MPATLTGMVEELLQDAGISEEYLDSREIRKLEEKLEEIKDLKDEKAKEKGKDAIEAALVKLIEKMLQNYFEVQRKDIEEKERDAERLVGRELDRRLRDIF